MIRLLTHLISRIIMNSLFFATDVIVVFLKLGMCDDIGDPEYDFILVSDPSAVVVCQHRLPFSSSKFLDDRTAAREGFKRCSLSNRAAFSLFDAVSGGEDPSLVDEHAPTPVADVAQCRQRNVHRNLKTVAFTDSRTIPCRAHSASAVLYFISNFIPSLEKS